MGWFRRTQRTGLPIRSWRAELARRQMTVVQERVELELARQRLGHLHRVTGPQDYEMVRQLDLHLAALKQARADLDQVPTRKRRWLDRFVVRLWDWSTRGKFEPPEEKVETKDPVAVS